MQSPQIRGHRPHEHIGRLQQAWDTLIAISAVAAAIQVPARLVLKDEAWRLATHFDWVITLVFAADLLRHVHLASVRLRPSWRVAKAPAGISSKWFAVDLCAAIPFSALPVPPPLQLLRLLKLTRVAERMWRWHRTGFHSPNVVRLALFPFWLILGVHWIACGWLILQAAPTDADGPTRYLNALYWSVTTLTTVGYGDVTPTTKAQLIYAMGTMLLGVGVYGYVIGNVAGLLANIDPARVRHQEAVSRITAFMRYRQVPTHLQQRILDYYEYLWEIRLGYDESAAISGLPPSLRTELQLHLNRDIIQKVPLFQGTSDGFIKDIALAMHPVVFLPGDYVVQAGETGEEMYFINRGTLEVLSPDETELHATLTAGDFFGEMALVFDTPRTASVRATDYCDLYTLNKATFDRIQARYPDAAAHVRNTAERRQGEIDDYEDSGELPKD